MIQMKLKIALPGEYPPAQSSAHMVDFACKLSTATPLSIPSILPPTQVLHTTYTWLEFYCQGLPHLFWGLKLWWCWLKDNEWPHFAWRPFCRVWAESRLSTRVSNLCLLSGHRDDLTMELLSAAKTEATVSWRPRLRHLGNINTDLRIMVFVYTKVRQLLKN